MSAYSGWPHEYFTGRNTMTVFELYHNGTLQRTFENFFDAVEYAEERDWDSKECEITETNT